MFHMVYTFTRTFLFLLFVGLAHHAHAQIGIGTDRPHSSSVVEVDSRTQGVLFPRMQESQKDAIANPPIGLLIYQIDGSPPGFYYYSGPVHGWLIYSQVGDPLPPVLARDAILEANIKNSSVSNDKIASATITGANIDGDAIVQGKFLSNTIEGNKIGDGEITLEKLAQSGANDGDVFRWDKTNDVWKPGSLPQGLDYSGLWDPSTNTPTLINGSGVNGDFYIVSTPGTHTFTFPIDFDAGDWVLYSNNEWIQIESQAPVQSVFGRNGSIKPEAADYNWAQIDMTNATINDISDVDLSTSPSQDQVLVWNNTTSTFVPGYEAGHPNNKIDGSGIENNAVTLAKVKAKSITTDKINQRTITSAQVENNVVTADNLLGGITLSKFSTASLSDGDAYVWSETKSEWVRQNISGGVNFQGLWDQTNNAPTLSDGDAGVSPGDYYTVSNVTLGAGGSAATFDFGSGNVSLVEGDWVIYSAGRWNRISNNSQVVSMFGRVGNVVPRSGDYGWVHIDKGGSSIDDLLDVVISPSISAGHVLSYDGTSFSWLSGQEIGSSVKPIDSLGLALQSVTGRHIASNSITAVKIARDVADETKIADMTLKVAKFEDKSITGNKLATNSISTANIFPNSINSLALQNKSIDTIHLKDDAIETNKIALKTLTADKFVNGSFSSSQIADKAISGDKVKDNEISANKLINTSLTSQKVALKTLTRDKFTTATGANILVVNNLIKDEGIEGKDFLDNSIESNRIKANSVDSTVIALGGLGRRNIVNAAITSPKIKEKAVTGAKIDLKAVLGADITANAIEATHIKDNVIDGRALETDVIISDTNQGSPNGNSQLEVQSTTKGMLLPKMTTAQRTAFVLGAGDAAMMVFDTDLDKIFIWNGTSWTSK